MRLLHPALLLCVLTLSGCVVNVKDVDSDAREASWQKQERETREAIAALSLGMGQEDVRARLGSPEFTEAFMVEGRDIRVLFYRTQRVHADGMTTREETTPLVFSDGRLSGWGARAWSEITSRPLSGTF